MPRPNAVNLQLEPGDKEKLEAIALQMGCMWGDRPNISQLVHRIAQGELRIECRDRTEDPRREAALEAIARCSEVLSKLLKIL